LSIFRDFCAHDHLCKLLKTKDVSLAQAVHPTLSVLQEMDVIVYALVAAVLLLVAVTFISSIDLSQMRRQ
jgi:hypothetical protein